MHHHNNHRHSSSNHNNPQHHKQNNNIPVGPSPGGASTPKKSNFLNRVRERFKEKDVTKEEVEQLGLKAKKETFKSQIASAKHNRPSKLGGLLYGSPAQHGSRSRANGRQQRHDDSGSFIFSNDASGGFGSTGFGSGLDDMFGAGTSHKSGKRKNQKSGFDEMFGVG